MMDLLCDGLLGSFFCVMDLCFYGFVVSCICCVMDLWCYGFWVMGLLCYIFVVLWICGMDFGLWSCSEIKISVTWNFCHFVTEFSLTTTGPCDFVVYFHLVT